MNQLKLFALLSVSSLVLAACGEEGTESAEQDDSENNSEQVDITMDTTEAEQEETSTEAETTEDEDAAEDSGDLPTQQPGDVIEAEAGTRTIVATNYGINETQENGPFEVTLLNAQVSRMETSSEEFSDFLGGDDLAMVSLQIEVSNNNEDTNTIYPDQGIIVTNNGNQVNADIFLSDDVGGDFYGEVIKTGDVFFFFDGNPEEIENIRYIISSGHDENYEGFGEDIEFSVGF